VVTFALRLSALQEAGDGVSAVLRALPHAGDDAASEQGTPRVGDGIVHIREGPHRCVTGSSMSDTVFREMLFMNNHVCERVCERVCVLSPPHRAPPVFLNRVPCSHACYSTSKT
jgi:hypothetical protein